MMKNGPALVTEQNHKEEIIEKDLHTIIEDQSQISLVPL